MKHCITVIFFSAVLFLNAGAQEFGIGASVNHLSNGINLDYTALKNERWRLTTGTRIMINTFGINPNLQDYSYYQCGYAFNFWQHFSLNFRANRKIVKYKFVQLDAISNLHFTWHGLLRRRVYGNRVESVKASPSAELVLGSELNFKLSSRLSAYTCTGAGIIYMHHHKDYTSFDWPNWERGEVEFVSIDGLPFMSAGIRYRLK